MAKRAPPGTDFAGSEPAKMDRRGILAEIRKCYQPHATEPVDLEEFLNVAKSIDDFCPTKVNSPGEPSK